MTPDERVEKATCVALNELRTAIGELEYAVGLAVRLHGQDVRNRREYLVPALGLAYDVKDLIEQAMPRPAVVEEEQE